MSKWITDRAPIESDAYEGYVWYSSIDGIVCRVPWRIVLCRQGTAWMPITKPEPYVKSKRYEVREWNDVQRYNVWDLAKNNYVSTGLIPTREAAERIAAIYEEVMP